ncbi:MAG TPA: MFS transporter [Ilumatobacter sp.]|jgi:predicted MFS family arabinose efflux permease|nr:MFS transporter [Ilumatobacter sp.]
MRPAPAATNHAVTGWGSPALRRATLSLAIAQLVSWGVLFYGFAVTAPEITDDTGWSDGVVAGAFALGLLISGVGAPPIARALARFDPRLVLTTGSIVGTVGMLAFAAAPNPVVLYLAWMVIGVAMAATLYEPAMAVLVALDPARRHRTLAVVTVAGGLASTVFAPLGGWLVEAIGWRQALAVLGVCGGFVTAVLHAIVLPPARAHSTTTQVTHVPAPPVDKPLRLLRSAVLFEQAAMIATTAYLIALLVDRGVELAVASAALGVMGLGKVAGRLLLLGPIGRQSLTALAAICTAVQLAGLALPLAVTSNLVLFAAMFVVGSASGATTVLRPLIVVELVGAAPFAATSARIQRASTLARAAAPLVLGVAATAFGWPIAWAGCLAAFGVAGERYLALGRSARG